MSFEFYIAKRYLKSKRKTGFISLITYISVAGVMIGVAALVIVLSVMNGFEREVRSRIIGVNAHVRVRTFHDRGIENYGAVMNEIQNVPHIAAMTPYVSGKGLALTKESTAGLLVKGIEPETANQVTDTERNIIYGELKLDNIVIEGEKTLPGIVLGFNLADRLVVTLGDIVTIMSPAGINPAGIMGQMPPMYQFRVTGYFETGLYEFDDTYAYISVKSAQKLFKMENKVTGIELKLDNLNQAEVVADQIRDRLGYPYRVLSWFNLNPNLFAWMQIEKWAAFIVLSLIIMVAAFNIISTLIMVVMEKTKEIGILKSMGATSKSIKRIFMFEGLVVGITGTIFGSIIGYFLCWAQQTFKFFGLPSDVYIISWLPVYMKWLDFVLVGLAAILISYVFSAYPAHRASKLDPVTSIRYQ